ncbi:MAG: phosphoadenylyl-sulfate reductase [Planctomycetota bacterium]|nr:MAG: phosphoadenylyl-sulfate reductase [Planctomycetota bacterium]RKY14329.1 MAG: phosphoadenylyl-sulfate reductase [Planctomycetota bacterium]
MQIVKEKKALVEELRRGLAGYSAGQLLSNFLESFQGRIVLASSMAAEDQVLTDMICKTHPQTRIITLDTGRLPQETYDVIEATQKHYGVKIKVLFPDYKQVEKMIDEHGPNLFFQSVQNRKLCCHIRKIEPLKRATEGMAVWICGLRKAQSVTRTELEPIAWDEQFGLIKLSPLLDWTIEQVWDYIRQNNVPCNSLHDKGYPSIGCTPCTRAVRQGQGIRDGRWWWEAPEQKECGLHWNSQGDKQ